MKNFKKTKPHQIFDERVNYVSHLKRIENLMSDQSPNTKRNKKERMNLISMMQSSRKIHQNSIKYEFSLRTQRQNQFLSNNFTHVKSVLKNPSSSRFKHQTSTGDDKKDFIHTKYFRKQNSDPNICTLMNPTCNNPKNNPNKASLNVSPKRQKLIPLKVRQQQQKIEQQNQRLVNRLLRVKPQISFVLAQQKKLKCKLKSKKQKILSANESKDKNSLLDQDFFIPNQSARKQSENLWKEVLMKTDMLKIYQNSKLNQTLTKKEKIVLKLFKSKKKLQKSKNSQKIFPQNSSVQQINNESIINNTQNSTECNFKLKKISLRFDQSFFVAAKVSKFQRKQIYSIEVRYGQNYAQRSLPIVLEDIIESEIILLLPIFKARFNKQNQGDHFEENQDLSIVFFRVLENKAIFKGSVELSDNQMHSNLQQTTISLKKKTCLTHRTNIPLLLGNSKTKNLNQFKKIQKQFVFPNGKKSIKCLNIGVRSQCMNRKSRKGQTDAIQQIKRQQSCERQ